MPLAHRTGSSGPALLILRQNLRVPRHFPDVTVRILKVAGVASPEGVACVLDDTSACAGCLLHQSVNLLARAHVVSERHICGATRLAWQPGVAGNARPRPERENEPALQLEERDCPVLELAADNALARQPEPVPIERERPIEVVDAKRYDSDSRFHRFGSITMPSSPPGRKPVRSLRRRVSRGNEGWNATPLTVRVRGVVVVCHVCRRRCRLPSRLKPAPTTSVCALEKTSVCVLGKRRS